MRRRPRWSLALVSCGWLLWASTAQAQNPVYPPGLEARVGALVFRGDGPPLGPHVEVSGASIEGDRVVVRLSRGGPITLGDREARFPLERVTETPSFGVWIPRGADARTRAAASALGERVSARDDGSVRAERPRVGGPAPPERPAESPPGHGWAWLLLLALGGGLIAIERRHALPVEGRERVALFAIFALALGLRLALPTWAPLHANEHGIAELRGLVTEDFSVDAMPYGGAHARLFRAALLPLGLGADAALALAALFGALAVVLLHRVAAQLVYGPVGPAIAALALALHPAHVRLSLSEDPRPISGALLLLGVLAGLLARRASRRSGRALGVLVAGLAWALALELRVITAALPIAGIVFVIVAGPEPTPDRAPRSRGLDLAAAMGAVAAVLWALWQHRPVLEAALGSAGERHGVSIPSRLLEPRMNLLLDPELTSVALLPAAAIGAALLWRSGRRRAVLAALAGFAILLPPSLFVTACRTDLIRYQSESAFFLFALTAGLAPRLWPATPIAQRAAWAAVMALLALAAPGLAALRAPDLHAQASAVVRRQAPAPPVTIRVAPREMPRERKVRSDFPDYLVASPERVRRLTAERLAPPVDGPCVVWVGPACWSFTDEEARRGAPRIGRWPFRAECVEMLGGAAAARAALAELTPVTVPRRDREFHRVLAERPRIGFARCQSERTTTTPSP